MKGVKTIAIYLPQYYETEYNNEWWGKGFTDWVAVKKAVPCFEGHKQPKIPLNKNYYNLLDKSTLEQQEKLMKQYGIYGLCLYHYYFKEGVKVLEKPAEILLKYRDIDIPFCFSWASEKWIRTWSNFYGNVWGEKFDKDEQQGGNGILLDQDFGSEKEWGAHFEYLLPFFKDERYIKIEDKPIFIFYHAEQIPCMKEMVSYWDSLCKENGLNGLYLIGSNITGGKEELDAVLINEPTRTRKELLKKGKYTVKNGVSCFEYKDFIDEALNAESFIGTKTYYCSTVGYDTTPRRGTNGECILNTSKELFRKLMDGLYKKSIQNGNEYVFVNAWNEWGEGMYLEPDEENQFAYLEAIKEVNDKYKNVEISNHEMLNGNADDISKQMRELNTKVNKFRSLYENSVTLATIIQNNSYSIKNYFIENDIHSVAIYGVGPLGKVLINQLLIENIDLIYTVDIYAARIKESIPMYRPFEELPYVDIMIVTAYGYEEIVENLKGKTIGCIKSVESWMNELRKYYA